MTHVTRISIIGIYNKMPNTTATGQELGPSLSISACTHSIMVRISLRKELCSLLCFSNCVASMAHYGLAHIHY